MSSTGHLLSGADAATAVFALTIFFGGAAVAVLAILVIYLIRRAGLAGIVGVLSGAGLVLVGAMVAAVLLDRQVFRDQAADWRTVELRSAELTARAIAPGSALACLDTVASVVVETACEKALFASPEAVAAAVAYVDARLSLLGAGAALAGNDKNRQSTFERMRRSLEADRFGLVAHVLTTRGCSPTDCPELALFKNSDKVVADMKAQIFESQVGVRALAWQGGTGVPTTATASLPSSLAPTGLSPMPATPLTSGGGPGGGKFDFPSASSIPPVSIMNAEPGSPPAAAEPKPAPAPKRAPARRQAAKPIPPPPPLPTTAPQQPAAPPAEPAQTSGSR